MKLGKIYKHTLLIGEQAGGSYIGQTCQTKVNGRGRVNGSGYKHSGLFGKAICDYGWNNFLHEIIEDNIATLEKANEREQHGIAYYHTYIDDEECKGYNLTLGGGSIEVSDTTRNRQSEAHRGQLPGNKGKIDVYSEDVKLRISKALVGKKQSVELIEKRAAAIRGCKHPHSEETKTKLSRAQKNKRGVNNGLMRKLINKDELAYYLNIGGTRGKNYNGTK